MKTKLLAEKKKTCTNLKLTVFDDSKIVCFASIWLPLLTYGSEWCFRKNIDSRHSSNKMMSLYDIILWDYRSLGGSLIYHRWGFQSHLSTQIQNIQPGNISDWRYCYLKPLAQIYDLEALGLKNHNPKYGALICWVLWTNVTASEPRCLWPSPSPHLLILSLLKCRGRLSQKFLLSD